MRGVSTMFNLKDKKGQALVEFAIILPVLLLLIMGIMEFGMMLNSYLTIENASREGARLGIVGGTTDEIKSCVISVSPNLNAADLSVLINPDDGYRNSGDTLTVTVDYNYHTTVPIISNLLNNIVVLKASTSMRIE